MLYIGYKISLIVFLITAIILFILSLYTKGDVYRFLFKGIYGDEKVLLVKRRYLNICFISLHIMRVCLISAISVIMFGVLYILFEIWE